MNFKRKQSTWSFWTLLLFIYPFLFLFNTQSNVDKADYIPEDYELVWSDEFDKSGAPSQENWTYDLGSKNNGWGNWEVQVYTKEKKNVRVKNGRLIINARKDKEGQWTSARLKSEGLRHFKYGLIEFKAKLTEGEGTWPALWLLGENIKTKGWPACGEIDVMEFAGKKPGIVQSALHDPESHGNTFKKKEVEMENLSSEFHTYAMLWTEDKIEFIFDGKTIYTYAPAEKNADNWPYDDKYFILMNIAMGGTFGSDPQYESDGQKNGIHPELQSATMEVDYVRVYQKKS